MTRARLLATSVLGGASFLFGCTGKADTLSFTSTLQQAESVGTSMSACPTLAANVTLTTQSGAPIITKACFLSDQGEYYPSGLSDTSAAIQILPGGHQYSIVYEFADGWVPSGANATSASSVFTAPEAIPSVGCSGFGLPEDDASNLAASRVTVVGNTLTQSLVDIVADGEQLVSLLDLSKLYACRSSPCGGFFGDGFTLRAYIAHVPPCSS